MLNDKQRAFVDAFCECWSATTAARKAGYSAASAANQGYRLMRNDEVVAEIRRRQEQCHLDAINCLHLLARQAAVDLSDLYDVVDGDLVLNLERAQENGAIQLVEKIIRDRDGRAIDVVLVDRQAALMAVAKHLRLTTERLDLLSDAERLPVADKITVAEQLLAVLPEATVDTIIKTAAEQKRLNSMTDDDMCAYYAAIPEVRAAVLELVDCEAAR